MARARGELAIAQSPHLTAQGLLGDRDPELLPEPLDQIDETPAHHPVHGRDRAIVEACHQGRSMCVGEPRGLAGWLAVDQTAWALRVELQDPVADDLQRDPANPGCLGSSGTLVDGRQGEQPPGLWAILALTREPAKSGAVEVTPERDRHGEPPAFATLNQTRPAAASRKRVTPSETWYKLSR